MLVSPIVGKVLEPEPEQHLRPLFGTALLGVERDDAPREQVAAREKPPPRATGWPRR